MSQDRAAANARVARRLTTILSADLAGYSRHMAADETGTLAALRQRRDVLRAAVERHDGRVVNNAGDGLLAEFVSVVEAVQAAVEAQREIGERNAGLPEDRRLAFRIGVNLGDVMVEDGDLFGDGVNVAARLQALADPGGILISGTVFDLVRDRIAVGYQPLGPQALKNLERPIAVWRVDLSGDPQAASTEPARPRASGPASAGDRWSGLRRPALLIVFLFALNILTSPGSLWFQYPSLVILLVVLWHRFGDRGRT